MAWLDYDKWKLAQYDGTEPVNFGASGDDLRIALVTSDYTPDRENHDFWSDVETYEVSGGNYTAGGAALTSKTLAVSNNTLLFDSGDVTFSKSATGFTNARYAILRKHNSTASASRLIAFYDLGADKGNVDGDLVLQTPNGIFSV